MKRKGRTRSAFCLLCLIASATVNGEIEKLSLPRAAFIDRTDLYTLKLFDDAEAVLVLCPGFNGDGKDWLRKSEWREFAKQQHLDLAAISFASDGGDLRRGRGYYYASNGSGAVLLDGLRRAFPHASRLLMFGFSGGAQFTSRFADWKPERLIAWCAYSAGWWDYPGMHPNSPPGLLMCGDDDPRFGASLVYFKQGRALGKPWLWVAAGRTGHGIESEAEDFARSYFAAVLKVRLHRSSGGWVDIDFGSTAARAAVIQQPTLYGWLPDMQLLSKWQSVNRP